MVKVFLAYLLSIRGIRGYNHSSLGALWHRPMCYNRHVNITEILKKWDYVSEMGRVCVRLCECDHDC